MKQKNFRRKLTSSGKLMLAGKNAEQNERIIEQAAANEIVLHTKQAGSPFVNIKLKKGEEYGKGDIKEAGIFCAKFSQAWKKAEKKEDVEVHVFTGKDIFKDKGMKLGTFGVRRFKKILIRKEEIEGK